MNALLHSLLWAATAIGSIAFGLQLLGYGTLFASLPSLFRNILGALMLVGGLLSLVNYVYHVMDSKERQ